MPSVVYAKCCKFALYAKCCYAEWWYAVCRGALLYAPHRHPTVSLAIIRLGWKYLQCWNTEAKFFCTINDNENKFYKMNPRMQNLPFWCKKFAGKQVGQIHYLKLSIFGGIVNS